MLLALKRVPGRGSLRSLQLVRTPPSPADSPKLAFELEHSPLQRGSLGSVGC